MSSLSLVVRPPVGPAGAAFEEGLIASLRVTASRYLKGFRRGSDCSVSESPTTHVTTLQPGLQLIAPMVAVPRHSSETTLTPLRSAGYHESAAGGPTAGSTINPSPTTDDLPSGESAIDGIAKDFDVDIERMLEAIYGSAVVPEAKEH